MWGPPGGAGGGRGRGGGAGRRGGGPGGGVGGQPKFPHSSAVDLLIDVVPRGGTRIVKVNGLGTVTEAEAARETVLQTLSKMAKGGIYDHLAGGFHRYSVDEHWVVPHFEKMAYDNSELLKNYVH